MTEQHWDRPSVETALEPADETAGRRRTVRQRVGLTVAILAFAGLIAAMVGLAEAAGHDG